MTSRSWSWSGNGLLPYYQILQVAKLIGSCHVSKNCNGLSKGARIHSKSLLQNEDLIFGPSFKDSFLEAQASSPVPPPKKEGKLRGCRASKKESKLSGGRQFVEIYTMVVLPGKQWWFSLEKSWFHQGKSWFCLEKRWFSLDKSSFYPGKWSPPPLFFRWLFAPTRVSYVVSSNGRASAPESRLNVDGSQGDRGEQGAFGGLANGRELGSQRPQSLGSFFCLFFLGSKD